MLRLHFPHVNGTRAPSFNATSAGKVVEGPDEFITDYEQRFTLWLQSLQLCRETVRYQDSEVTIWFVAGFLVPYQLFLSQERVDLKQFHLQHRLDETEPFLPLGFQYYHLCERLCLSLSDALTRFPSLSPPLGGHVSLIDNEQSSPGLLLPTSLLLTPMLVPSTIDTSKVAALWSLVPVVLHLVVPIALALVAL